MSTMYDRVRSRAVDYALIEYGKDIREVGAENRGERIEVYMRASGAGVPRNNPTWVGRDWCGMFIYWCYLRAAREQNLRLPFRNPTEEIWSGQKLVKWAGRNPSAVVNQSTQTARLAAVKRGDIYVARNHHIGMAMEDSRDGATFLSVDGNQSTALAGNQSITCRNSRRIANCLVIVRI